MRSRLWERQGEGAALGVLEFSRAPMTQEDSQTETGEGLFPVAELCRAVEPGMIPALIAQRSCEV